MVTAKDRGKKAAALDGRRGLACLGRSGHLFGYLIVISLSSLSARSTSFISHST